MITKKNVVDLLLNICTNNLIVQRSAWGEIWQLDEEYKKDKVYPAVYIVSVSDTLPDDGGVATATFRVLAYDILLPDKSNKLQVHSDTLTILNWIIKEVQSATGGLYGIVGDTLVTSFFEEYQDAVTGNEMLLTIEYVTSTGNCDVPEMPFVVPGGGGGGNNLIIYSGPQGARGARGETGPTGVTGIAGPQGFQGVQGLRGPQGFVGATGVQGASGPQGLANFNVTIDAYAIGSTVQGLLGATANWSANGAYIGATVTGTHKGQKFYNDNFFFEAVADNTFIRLARV